MDVKEAMRKIEEVLDELNDTAYEQGKADCRDEMQSELRQARDDGYDEGHGAGYKLAQADAEQKQ